MKTIISTLLLLTLASCSTFRKKDNFKIESSQWDAIGEESFQRWGDKRLSTVASDNLVVGCYKGDIKATLEKYKESYEHKDQNPYYWLHIGNCYLLGKEIKKAQFYYRIGLEEAKTGHIKALAHNNLGLIHLKYKQWQAAKNSFKKAMSFDKSLRVPAFNLAQVYLQFGHHDQAISLLTKPEFRDYQDIDVVFSLANAYLFKGDIESAEEQFELIPKEYFQREDIALTYSLYLIQKGDVKKAKDVMAKRDISSVREMSEISRKVESIIEGRLGK